MPGLWQLAAALAVTIGLLVVFVHFMKRFQSGARGVTGGLPLRLIGRLPLGPKQGVGLLQVGDRVLLISIAEGGIHTLAELENPLRRELIETATPRESKLRPPFRTELLRRVLPLSLALLALAAGSALADPPAIAPQFDMSVGGSQGIQLSGAVGLVVFIGFLTLLPAMLLLMTSFTRILIVLQFIRPALGVQNSPPTQILAAIALMLSAIVMGPTLERTNREALQPYFRGEISQSEAYTRGIVPFREFMLENTGQSDLVLFSELGNVDVQAQSEDEIPTFTLIASFVTSELRTAFQMGFVIFLPFIVVDLIVASVLMSLGMFMLPPMMVSLPFKLLLFVLADGWTLVVKNLVLSFGR